MDIKIDCEEGKFKYRVCGILKHGDKYLVVKINNNAFYCLPGGHVELGEDTDTAVRREMKEELGFDVKIKKLIEVNQNFFKAADGKAFHELGFYYIVEAVNEKDVNPNDYIRDELDKGQIQHLDFKWVTKEDLAKIDFRPVFVKNSLNNERTEISVTRD